MLINLLMSQNLVVVQQYLSWKGHYKQYFENLFDLKYSYAYASNKPEQYDNALWIKSDFDSDKPLTIESKIKGRFLDSFNIFKMLSKSNFDIIHLIEFEPLTYLLFANRFRKSPLLIITIHSSDRLHYSSWINNKISGFQRAILNLALRKAINSGAFIVTHYECHKQSILNIIGRDHNDRVKVINYPAPKPEIEKARIFGNAKSPKYLIYGQIREDKGIYEFLKNESTKSLNITIAGKIVDTRVFEFANRSGLTIIDKFLTEEEIKDLTDTHDFMLLPYPIEYTNGAGTFKDSLAKGMPVVCSDISIFREIIDLHNVGFIFKNPDEIVQLSSNLSNEEYVAFSQNCLDYAATYNWKYMKTEYFSLYNKIIQGNHASLIS